MVVVNLKPKDKLHYSFCQDLGNKTFAYFEKEEGKGFDSWFDIKWGLFRVKQTYGIFGGGPAKLPGSDVYLPGNYEVERVGKWTDILTKEKSYQVFLAPDDYYKNGCLVYEKAYKNITIPLSDAKLGWDAVLGNNDNVNNYLQKQPHLFSHSTFQFSFLRNVLFSTNLQFLNIDENNQIIADIAIHASPTGTYFLFQSGEIPFKWKIDVRQGVVVMDLMKDTMEAINKTVKKVGAGLAKGFSGGLVNLDGTELDAIEGLMGNMSGKDNWQKMGLDKERVQRTQEQQTERLFKSTTTDILDKTIEPSIFYSNSVQFPYNLFDFFIRAFQPHYEARIHITICKIIFRFYN